MSPEWLLLVMNCFRGERSLSAVYHLLQGKRAIQTIYDAHLFQLQRYLGLFPTLSRADVDTHVSTLVEAGFLTEADKRHELTEQGQAYVASWRERHAYVAMIDQWQFGRVETTFWQRLMLLCQSLAHVALEKPFVPIVQVNAIQRFVKRCIPRSNEARKQLREQLYQECLSLLSQVSTMQAEVFVRQLSSPDCIGATSAQLARVYAWPVADLLLLHKGTLHFILAQVIENKHDFPGLSQVIESEEIGQVASGSARETDKLLRQGVSIQHIAQWRRLKMTTIEDHLVELALLDQTFPINRYVSSAKQKAILEMSKKSQTFTLKKIRQALNQQVSYFEIRIVLARKET